VIHNNLREIDDRWRRDFDALLVKLQYTTWWTARSFPRGRSRVSYWRKEVEADLPGDESEVKVALGAGQCHAPR
jgi:hypothetical protein